MFPIWPVVRPKELLDACADPESLTPSNYCLLLALSAATTIQLKLASNHLLSDLTDETLSEVLAPYTTEYLLIEAINARDALNIAKAPDVDTLLTSCFLFSAYANLDRLDEAWFYLSQTVSFVISLRLQDEASYPTLSPEEAERRCRIFWMVFLLERYLSLSPLSVSQVTPWDAQNGLADGLDTQGILPTQQKTSHVVPYRAQTKPDLRRRPGPRRRLQPHHQHLRVRPDIAV